MTILESYARFNKPRKVVIMFYHLVMLSSIIATRVATAGDKVDDDILLVEGELDPMHTGEATTNGKYPLSRSGRKRMLYAASTFAGPSKYQTEGRRGGAGAHPQATAGTGNNATYSSTADSNVDVSEACSGDHGLEVQQDNNTDMRGLPVYHVSVINTCLDCSIQDIHVACGDWASATEVDPLVFKRITYNDCVVNAGKPIAPLGVVYFEYSNSFPYPMNVQTAFPSCS